MADEVTLENANEVRVHIPEVIPPVAKGNKLDDTLVFKYKVAHQLRHNGTTYGKGDFFISDDQSLIEELMATGCLVATEEKIEKEVAKASLAKTKKIIPRQQEDK